MTLVVVRKVRKSVLLASDTKLTPPLGERWTIKHQSQKVLCVGDWCIAYAGNVYAARTAIHDVATSGNFSFRELKEGLVSANRLSMESGDEAEFILVSTISQSIHKISQGVVNSNLENAWIGSKEAFGKFQSLFHRAPNEPHPLITPAGPHSLDGGKGLIFSLELADAQADPVFKRMTGAVDIIINDNTCPDVGGFTIGLVVANKTAKIWPRLAASAILAPSIQPSSTRDALFGEAQTGDHTYSVMGAVNANENVIAIALAHAQIGIILRDDPTEPAEIIDNINFGEARTALEQHLGIPLWAVNLRNEGGRYVLRDQ